MSRRRVDGYARWTVGLALALLFAGLAPVTASAQPIGWIQVKTEGFTMYLPKNWRFIKYKARDPKKPWLGSWRYASPNRGQRIFVRLVADDGTEIAAGFEKGLAHLRKRVPDLKSLGPPTIQANPKFGIDFAMGSFSGTVRRRDRKTKEVKTGEAVILRMQQRFRKSKLALMVSYLFTGGRQEELMAFFNEHNAHLRVPRAIEIAELERQMKAAGKAPAK